ncbi:MAG: CDP-alcohol phosphatidyltransferase family protein [Candidatus Hodarchaeota archaeon]
MSIQRFLARGKSNNSKDEDESYKKEDFTLRLSRSISQPITNLIYPINVITPNRITWLGFIIAVLGAGILIIADTNIILLFLVGLCYWISGLLDCVDGQLARMRGIQSNLGQWFDGVLEDGKGFPFFVALGIHIQDVNGLFTLQLGSTSITLHVWFTIFVMYAGLSWLSMMSMRATRLLGEPAVVSHGHLYIIWAVLILNILDWFLVLYTVAIFLTIVYTFIEKTFLYSAPSSKESSEDRRE